MCLSQASTDFQLHISCFFSVQYVEVRGGSSFCWYWWNFSWLCPKLAQISNCIYHVFFLFSMLRWEVVVHFVDIDGIFPDCQDYIYSETCLNRTLNKPKSCINRTLNKLKSCINRTLNKPKSCINRTLNKLKSYINRTLNKLKSYINRTLNKPKSCINRTLNKPKSCINRILNKVPIKKIFVNLTCINQTPVYSEHNSWSQGSSV